MALFHGSFFTVHLYDPINSDFDPKQDMKFKIPYMNHQRSIEDLRTFEGVQQRDEECLREIYLGEPGLLGARRGANYNKSGIGKHHVPGFKFI